MPVFDIENAADRGRLVQAIHQCGRDMQGFIRARDQCLALYRGNRWGRQRWQLQKRVPVPFMQLALDVHTQHLSSIRPQALIVTEEPRFLATADKLGIAENRLFDEIGFGPALRMFVQEALIGYPMMKVSLSEVTTSRMHGWRHKAGQPFTDVVYTPDLVIDMSAFGFDRVAFVGNRYRVPLEWVKKNAGRKKLYRKEDVDKLSPMRRTPVDRKKPQVTVEPIYDMVELIDLYFPLDNWFTTIPAPEQHEGDIVLHSGEWNGPKGGPYVPLSFGETQEEVLPVPPAWSWIDGHLAVNTLYNKLIEQAEDMKEVIGAQGNAVGDAERLIRARHGQIWRFDHPQNVKEFRFSGPDQPVMSFAIHLRSLLSHIAGNVDLMAGLQAQSGTATQDQLLFAQGSRRIQDLQQRVTATVEQIMRRLAWYLFHDPDIDIPLTRRIGNVEVPSRLRHNDIRGDFLDYNFRIEPHSMRFKTPEERLAQLDGLMGRVMNMAQIILQQGNTIDVSEYLRIAGDYSGLSEMDRIVRRSDREIPRDQSRGASGLPSTSQREYVRRGVSANANSMDAVNRLPGTEQGGNGRG